MCKTAAAGQQDTTFEPVMMAGSALYVESYTRRAGDRLRPPKPLRGGRHLSLATPPVAKVRDALAAAGIALPKEVADPLNRALALRAKANKPGEPTDASVRADLVERLASGEAEPGAVAAEREILPLAQPKVLSAVRSLGA